MTTIKLRYIGVKSVSDALELLKSQYRHVLEDSQHKGDSAFEAKAVKALCTVFAVPPLQELSEFTDSYRPPIALAFCRKKHTLEKLYKDMYGQEVWKIFTQVLSEAAGRPNASVPRAGVIMYLFNKLYILHNWWTLEGEGVRICWRSRDAEQGIILESLPQFCIAMRKVWSPSE